LKDQADEAGGEDIFVYHVSFFMENTISMVTKNEIFTFDLERVEQMIERVSGKSNVRRSGNEKVLLGEVCEEPLDLYSLGMISRKS